MIFSPIAAVVSQLSATPAQESLWWIHHRTKNSAIYHLTWRLALDEAPGHRIEAPVLSRAWQTVVDRHEALRTSLVRHDGTLVQRIHEHLPAPLTEIDWPDVGELAAGPLLDRIAEELHEEPFALDQAPLARAALVRVADRTELHITVHHSVADGWAMQLLLTDLSAAYEAASREEPSRQEGQRQERQARPEWQGVLAGPAVPAPQFCAYTEDVAQAAETAAWRHSLDYWRHTLTGRVTATVAADHDGGSSQQPGAVLRRAVSQRASMAVDRLAHAAAATPFTVYLAAVQTVLARGGAGPEVVLGLVTANRMTTRDQAIVGYLANVLALPGRVAGQDTLADVVSRARDAVWDTLAHQHVPYATVHSALDEATQAGLGDTFPVLLTYHGQIGTDLSVGGVPARLLASPSRSARTDLTIGVFDAAEGTVIELEYHTGRYCEATVAAFLTDIENVLAADPGRQLAELEVASRTVIRHAGATTAASIAAPGRAPGGGSPTGTPLEQRVLGIWNDVLGVPAARPDDDFFASGGHSLTVMRLAAAVERELGAELDVVAWLADPCPRRILELLSGPGVGDAAARTFAVLRDGKGPRLHLVHPIGGSLHAYRPLVAELPANWRITASQDPGTNDASIEQMAERYLADLDEVPDLLGGWSLGGVIAYEMAVTLARRGMGATTLVLIDSFPPVGRSVVGDLFAAFTADVFRSLALPPSPGPELGGTGDRQVRLLAAQLRTMGEEVSPDQLRQRWESYRRHSAAAAKYRSDESLPGPAVLARADLAAQDARRWGNLLPVREVAFSADHYALMRAPAITEVARLLEQSLPC
jgi:thioesterase domain-containing protein